MSSTSADESTASRLSGFASFFKRYMGVAALVTAALPIPIAKFRTIPLYASQAEELATYASLLCFLFLAYFFYLRHSIASVLFLHRHSRRLSAFLKFLPLIFIVACVASIFAYQSVITDSVNESRLVEMEFEAMHDQAINHRAGVSPDQTEAKPLWASPEAEKRKSMSFILDNTEQNDIPKGWLLFTLYLSIFICAEVSFVLMALREYLQDILNLSDVDIVKKIEVPPPSK